MTIDYSQGKYSVLNASGAHIGRIDEDEFIRQGSTLLYRLDGSEVYAVNGGLLGFIDAGVAKKPDGQVLFSIQPE
jgi:hypothetical protein